MKLKKILLFSKIILYYLQGLFIRFFYYSCSEFFSSHIDISEDLKDKPFLYVCWHKHVWAVLYFLLLNKDMKIAIVMSNHPRNYRFIPFFKKLNIGIIRQSDFSDNSFERLYKIKKYIHEGYSIFNFSDGPEGPPKKVKPDMILLASKLNLDIVPIICTFDKKKYFKKSWDNSYFMSSETRKFYARTEKPIKIETIDEGIKIIEKKLKDLERNIII